MHLKIFTIPFSTREFGFDTSELEEFQSKHVIEDIQTHFFEVASLPCLVVFMRYLPCLSGSSNLQSGTKRNRMTSSLQKTNLEGRSKKVSEALKDWRKKRSASDGVPPFLVLTNQQVLSIAITAPVSLKELGEIKGIGQAKLKNYGPEILEIIKTISSKEHHEIKEIQ